MANIFKNKNILVTGGSGSIGSEIVRRVMQYEPAVVRVFSNDENGQFSLQQELPGYDNLRFLIGDVKDKERLGMAVEGIDFVFHAAALKHVPLCEYNPFEAVKTNVLGTQNIIEAARAEEVEKVIAISTDKAVNPVNVMGATKLLAERLMISASHYEGERKTAFSCVRFGNVLNSRGSVVPLFRQQIAEGGPVTLTDPDMTRFIMPLNMAVELVLQAVEMAEGGEIFIFKMPTLRIGDLVEVMIEELAPQYGHDPKNIEVKMIGKRAGEKTYEELLTKDEATGAHETGEMFVIPYQSPEKDKLKEAQAVARCYTTEEQPLLNKEDIRELLKVSDQECS